MAVFAVLVSRRRVLLGLFVLPVGVMMGCLVVMVCGGVMVCSGLSMMLDGRVFGLLCHTRVLRKGSWEHGRIALNGSGCRQTADKWANLLDSRVL
jgi:hypothetical protein